MKTPHQISQLFAAYVFLAMLVTASVLSVMTLAYKRDGLAQDDATFERIVTGKATLLFEEKYGEHLWGRTGVITPWNAVSYALFQTGDKKIILGNEDWIYFREEVAQQPDEAKETAHKLRQIAQVRDYLAQKNIALIVALLPSKARVYPEYLRGGKLPEYKQAVYKQVRAELLKEGILTPDLLRYFMQHRKDTLMFLKTDTHWSPQGATLVANELAAQVATHCTGVAWNIAPYKTYLKTPKPYDGDLLKFMPTGFLRSLIGPEGETITPEVTHLEEGAAPVGDLFGDQQIGITLVGTSFSFMQHLNFEGALKAAFSTDVLNLATEGQGPMKPMAEYLKNTDLSVNPPQLIIWEIPERFMPIAYKDVSFDFLKEKMQADFTRPADAPVCQTQGGVE